MGFYQKKSISQLFTLFKNTILQYSHLSFLVEKKGRKAETCGLYKNYKMISKYEINYTS